MLFFLSWCLFLSSCHLFISSCFLSFDWVNFPQSYFLLSNFFSPLLSLSLTSYSFPLLFSFAVLFLKSSLPSSSLLYFPSRPFAPVFYSSLPSSSSFLFSHYIPIISPLSFPPHPPPSLSLSPSLLTCSSVSSPLSSCPSCPLLRVSSTSPSRRAFVFLRVSDASLFFFSLPHPLTQLG